MSFTASGPARLLLLFGAASFAAVALGALTCTLSGVPTALWARNLAAWLVGGLAAAAVARAGPRATALAPWLAPVLIAATFLGAGQAGVHRWVSVGPLGLNAAMLVTPALVVALAAGAASPWRWATALASLVLIVLQPDASQATALGAALALIAALGARGPARAALAAASAGLALLAWLRPDPLQPVPEVEEIFSLALAISPALAALSLAALAAAAAVPALAARRGAPEARLAGAALSLCLALWIAMTFAGAFPVPLVGIGVSPILGSWLGVGLLAGLAQPGQATK